ncbi:MAG: universal stress protein [Eggerthellaceae bacterium]|nr:universal stress protein [Eggerthellaceae bacterium]
MARYNRIFAALDGTEAQIAIARRTLSIAHDNKAEVLFAHVIDASELEMGRVSVDEYVNKSKQAIENALERQLAKAANDECLPSVEIKVAAGRTNDVLGELAKDFNPDLVICGVRGLSNIKYAFVGSTSTFLVRHMECDVLVVRPEAIEEIDESEYE